MAAMTLLEEELQNNMVTSEEDGDFEEDDEMDVNMVAENANAFAANKQLLNGVSLSETDDVGTEEDGNDDEEGSGEEGEEDDSGDGDELSDDDAEGEEDEDVDQSRVALTGETQGDDGEEDGDEESDSDEDEEGEGVGAVKIRPGVEDDEDAASPSLQDDEEESEDSDEAESKQSSDAESDVEAEWEAAAEEDEPIEPIDNSRCIFCNQDEEHDPSEDYEEYMSCTECGDHSHRQCARDADALKSDVDAEKWRCPDCVSHALAPEVAMADAGASLAARRSSAPKLARDLLPSQRGAIRPDSHSVFNHLIVDDDPMDGSRLLRKRKTSSAEAEDHVVSSFRKRRKNNSSGSNAIASEGDGVAAENDNATNGADQGEIPNSINSRPSRSLRIKIPEQPHAFIIKKGHQCIIISFRLDTEDVQNILSRTPKPKKKRSRSIGASSAAVSGYTLHGYSQPFYSLHDRENEELKSKPYGGILKEGEADTSQTLPQPGDRRRFDDARQKAEEDWKIKSAAAQAEAENVKKPRKVSGPASQIECINFGGFEIDTWYAAPYPEEYSRNRVLFICEFCLKYMNSEYVAWRHKMKCQAKHPPGDEIYRDGSVGVFEVDGRKNPVYCQNLCLLAKLFLGSKTLYYDVEPFLFYVMTETDDLGCHFVGYFSKEKRPSSQNNVSCILTLPIHQRKGYGNLLIDFSYLLTRVERKSGSPEKPLSDMGLVSYRNYWRLILCYQLRNQKDTFSIIDISERTGMTADDIVSALEGLRALVRDPVTGTYALRLDYDFYDEYIQKWENKSYVKLNEKALVWTPYIMGRNNQSMVEHGPPLTAIAPREGDEDEAKSDSALPPPALVNGDSQISSNGTTNEDSYNYIDSQEQTSKASRAHSNGSIKIDEQKSDPVLTNGTSKEENSGKIPYTEPSASSPARSPSRSVSRLSVSAPPQINGFPAPASTLSTNSISSIPPTRFEVFPPVPGHRPANRSRPIASRPKPKPTFATSPSTPRSSASRRRSAARRSSGSRPSSSSRRRTGGTGRGPGRWPKGTKKSDFGNADSGPGLPPRLLKQQHPQRSRLAEEVTLGSDEDEDEMKEEDEDAILYETPGRNRRRDRDRRKAFELVDEDEDQDLEDDELVVGDVDAEGEDE